MHVLKVLWFMVFKMYVYHLHKGVCTVKPLLKQRNESDLFYIFNDDQ